MLGKGDILLLRVPKRRYERSEKKVEDLQPFGFCFLGSFVEMTTFDCDAFGEIS
jgi:hypothetical protein